MTRAIFIVIVISFTCSDSFGQTKKDSLYVFVGKKIEVITFKQKMDSKNVPFNEVFKAKYEIIQNLYGSYDKDTIEFLAYDHYGKPAFSQYDYVLLFVSTHNGKLYHEKYQYFDVYKTKNGRWASSYKVNDYGHPYNKNTSVKPEIIDFLDEVSYKIQTQDKEEIEEEFPAPYYTVKNDKAIVIWGNYIEQLFELKKSGVLKARGIFD